MKTSTIPVYANSVVYRNIALSVYKIDYILGCLEYKVTPSIALLSHAT